MRQTIGILVVVTTLLWSCNSDEQQDVYSERGAGYDKNILEASSKSLNKEIEQLAATDFATVSHSMHQRIGDKELKGNGRFFMALVNIGNLMYEGESSDCYYDELMKMTFDKEYYCNALYEQGPGVWTWNTELADFEKIDSNDQDVIFNFPATNNVDGDWAALTVSELLIYEGKFPGKGEQLADGTIIQNALEAIRFDIKIVDQLILTSNVLSSYTAEGFYNDVAMTFNPTPYNLYGELARQNNTGYWEFSFNRDSENVLKHDLRFGFDVTDADMPINTIDNELTIVDVVMNTRAQTGNLYNELQKASKFEEGTEAHAQKLVEAFNNYAEMDVRYLSDNSIIAKVQAVSAHDEDDAGKWIVHLMFEFSDGTQVSGEEYFDDYLSDFKIELEQLVNEFELKFGV